jgi:GntR family transcriptional regulator, rspAB operon transcriptional repressor
LSCEGRYMRAANATTVLAKIEQRRAVDEVYERLRDAILTKQFSPGQRLDVDAIAHQLGVSLTPVRSAIELLASDGLVDVQPRSGTFVTTLTARDVEETMDIRCALECLAAEKAVERLTADDIENARRLLKILAKPIHDEQDSRNHESANSQLHNLLIEASGNRILSEMYRKLNAHLTIARLHSRTPDWRERTRQEQIEHEEMVDAMERRDPAALVDTLRRHILRAEALLLATIEKSS